MVGKKVAETGKERLRVVCDFEIIQGSGGIGEDKEKGENKLRVV